MTVKLTIPDLGDFDDVEVIEVLIEPGDTVAVEDPLVTLETDKAMMDVPSPAGGRVVEVLVEAGAKVSAGSIIATIEADASVEATAAAARPETGRAESEPGSVRRP